MRRELQAGNRSIFSGLLQEKITAALAQKEQVILFLNRRGYHTFVSCRACGEAIHCRHCAVALAYHQASDRLKCHYCGYEEKLPVCCPKCGSTAIRQFGIGTQKVTEAVQTLWPQAKVLRLDRDATRQRGSHETIYRAMYQGEADILVGTQMVVKGLDFPKVNLVGVLAADASLFLPELFAAERTFQLLTQVAGRAGRRDKTGEVIVQTYQPGHHLLREAARQDYASFYEQEIAWRRLLDNPPYSVLIRLLCTSPDQQKALYFAETLAGFIKLHLTEEERLLGPQEAPLAKIKDRFRVQMIVKGQKLPVLRQHLQQALAEFYKCGKMIKDTQVAIDVEPLTTI